VRVVGGSNPLVPTFKLAPSILLTNDDGIHSPAFDALESALAGMGDIRIVAPDREMSASSQSLTLNQPLRFHQIKPNRFAVQGTPADCVIIAAIKILKKPPDLVISGINRGWNIGDDIAYSGTVAGAFEAALQGLPGMAVSTKSLPEPDFENAALVAARIAAKVLKDGLPPDVVLNVNFPESWGGEMRVTQQGRRAGKTVLVENMDPRGREYFWLHEELHKPHDPIANERMTDYVAIKAGYVSVTPLQIDRTAHEFLDRITTWLL
jgi:5'-nucleotidase